MRLLRGFENKNHIIYFDSFYSPALCMYLKDKRFAYLGMVQRNRKGLDKMLRNQDTY